MKRLVRVILVLSMVIFLLLISVNIPGNTSYGEKGPSVHSSQSSLPANNSSLTFVAPSIAPISTTARLNETWSSMFNYTLERMNDSSIPQIAKMLPNFNVPNSGKLVTGPVYTSAPAPMGLASYGLRNESGTIVPYTYTTGSFDGRINISSVSEFYPGTSSPYSFSIQFNAVLTGVTIAGVPGYEYWIQNVAFYSSRIHQLTFVDNIWNFSSPNAVINNGTFHSYTGNLVPGLYYYKVGPTYTVAAPFSLSLYLNTTNVAQENSVFFNYTLTNASFNGRSGTFSSSYDNVQFNSTLPGFGSTVPDAYFKVSGNTLSGTGAIPLDAELDLGGPGGGSTADFNQINASLNMYYQDSSFQMVPIGSAYDSGSATGETSSGVSSYYTGTTEYLFTGPSFISGLWNITSPSESGFALVTASINPESAFVMFSHGSSFSSSDAQWAPTGTGGTFTTHLMPGTYAMKVMLSYHNPSSVYPISLGQDGFSALGSITLTSNETAGLYTPLYISGNAEMAQLAISGNGSERNPYVLPGYGYLRSMGLDSVSTLNQAFNVVNDYLFPEFTGLLVKDSSSYAVMNGFKSPGGGPAFQYVLSGKLNLAIAQLLGMTAANNLGIYFYNSSHVIMTNSTISGAYPAEIFSGNTYYNVPYVAGLTLWNVTSSLVENNLICSEGSGLLIYGDASISSGNYVWNNTFINAPVISNGSYYGFAPIGLTVESSGNTVFNNIFDTTITIVSIDGLYANIYNDGNVTYHNAFNISRRSAASSTVMDGEVLTGSIIGGSYQGGNFYYNYFGDGSSPYNGSGLGLIFPGQNIFNGSINDGFDFVPLQLYTTMVNVSASGLPVNQITYFDINNAVYSISYGSVKSIYVPNGTYQILGFILLNTEEEFVPTSYIGSQMLQSGVFYVHGPVGNIFIEYNLYMNVTVKETGIPAGSTWGFSIPQAGIGFTLDGGSVSIFLEYGKLYQIFPQSVPGYYTDSFYPFTVTGSLNITIAYFPTGMPSSFSVTFHETGLPSGTLWHVYIDTQEFNSTSPTMTILNFTDGTYAYNVSHLNGYQNIEGQQFTVNQSNITIELMFTRTSGSTSSLYIIVGAILGLVTGSIITYALIRRRRREIPS